jgi:hypothetical protein
MELRKRQRRYLEARDALRALPGRLEADIAAIRADEWAPGEEKELRIKKARADAAQKWPPLREKAQRALEEAEDLIRRARSAYRVNQSAQARVRHLLGERKLAPDTILRQARELRDAETVAALRAEMLYWGNEDGFADAEETILACERALGELDVGNYAEHARIAAELREFAGQLQPVVELASLSAEGADFGAVATARMKVGHAIPEERPKKEEREERPVAVVVPQPKPVARTPGQIMKSTDVQR